MTDNTIVQSIFTIFCGAAIFSTVALYTRQSLMVSYMLLGMILGPWALAWVSDTHIIGEVGEIGIIFLLFLLGLHLDPQHLMQTLKKTTIVAIGSSLVFASTGYLVGVYIGLPFIDSLVIGLSMMFSSTIISLKLLPSNILHHRHVGEVLISVLLLQDLIAMFVLLTLRGMEQSFEAPEIAMMLLSLPLLIVLSLLGEKYVLLPLFKRFEKVREYLFLLAIAWCLGLSELAVMMDLSNEIGAFVAGVSIASSGRISLYLAESLRPLRDFFLVMFFFSVGANFNVSLLSDILLPTLLLSGIFLILKPVCFRYLLTWVGEDLPSSWEVGFRLGQGSEFALMVAALAVKNTIGSQAAYIIQGVTMITFVLSSYYVVKHYVTPIGAEQQMPQE
ncbi:MAG TPA: cation:proton antiporter [Gammaproteobacteria bacterium]|nr:cation:proton antiporter [Gammaproteobacteria bacterium]